MIKIGDRMKCIKDDGPFRLHTIVVIEDLHTLKSDDNKSIYFLPKGSGGWWCSTNRWKKAKARLG